MEKKILKIDLVREISSKLEEYIDQSLDWSLDPDKFKERFQIIINKIITTNLDVSVKDRLFDLWFDKNELGRKLVTRFLIAYKYTRKQDIIMEPWEGKTTLIYKGSNYKKIREEIISVSKTNKKLLELA
jgi:hypothetical protein